MYHCVHSKGHVKKYLEYLVGKTLKMHKKYNIINKTVGISLACIIQYMV